MSIYTYSEEDSLQYEKLGIIGTTYEGTFIGAKKTLGNLSGEKYLDFGSGTGRSSLFLLELGASEVIGVDHNESMIKNSQKRENENLKFMKTNKSLPFKDEEFDGCFCSWVFMEIGDIKEIQVACNEIYRVLKPGGRFTLIVASEDSAFGNDYISFRYISSPESLQSGDKTPLLIKGENDFIIDDYYRTQEDYKSCLLQSGFSIESVDFPIPTSDGPRLSEKTIPAHMIVSVKK